MTNTNNNPSQRNTSYRACLPFYILYDLDLNANHLRLYGQIEQMESNPNALPTFSYSWIANQLGINHRNARKVAKLLIDKGYVEHKEVSEGKYVWNTKKAQVVVTEDSKSPKGGGRTETPRGVAQRPPKIPEDKLTSLKPLSILEKTPKSPSDYKEDAAFMSFYEIYPNKQKPKIAYQAFLKNRLNQSMVDFIIEDVLLRKENNWKGRDKSKIPHPATYLNSREWEGEIYVPQNKTVNANKPKRYTMDELMGAYL